MRSTKFRASCVVGAICACVLSTGELVAEDHVVSRRLTRFNDSAGQVACAATLKLPKNGNAYGSLLRIPDRKLHMTCPFVQPDDSKATVFILAGAGECYRTKLYGFRVLRSTLVPDATAKKSYAQCGGAEQPDGPAAFSRPTVTYVWYSAQAKEVDRHRDMNGMYGRLSGGIVASGLPVLNFDNENDVFCFQIDARSSQDFLAAVRDAGIPVPKSVREKRLGEISCDEAKRL